MLFTSSLGILKTDSKGPYAAYRMKKFVRRHRFGVAAGSVVALALVLGVVGTSMGMVWAIRERAQAREEARRAEASNLFALGQNLLEENPSGALAYAMGKADGLFAQAGEELEKLVPMCGRPQFAAGITDAIAQVTDSVPAWVRAKRE